MGSMTLPLNAAQMLDPREKPALELLTQIQQYVETWRFTPTGLARGLGRRDINAVEREIIWLAAHNYLKDIGSDLYRLTTKGWAYEAAVSEHPNSTDDEDS